MTESGNTGGWWKWAINTKDKVVNHSSEVLGYVKKDIDEFAKVVSEEATSMVSATANAVKDRLQLHDEMSTATQMKNSMSGFFQHVAEVFIPNPDDSEVEGFMICNQQPVLLDRLQIAIYHLSSDPSTFLEDPKGEEMQYKLWLENFKVEDHQHELSDILLMNQALQQTYTTIVPSKVDHISFWNRYYYKIYKLNESEAIRKQMKMRAQTVKEDSQISWEEDDPTELPEQLQKKLLEDYENELKGKDRKEIPKPEANPDKEPSKLQANPDKELSKPEVLPPDESPCPLSEPVADKEPCVPTNAVVSPCESLSVLNEEYFSVDPEKEKLSDSPLSSKDTDESWEKIQASDAGLPSSRTDSFSNKSDDWETWE